MTGPGHRGAAPPAGQWVERPPGQVWKSSAVDFHLAENGGLRDVVAPGEAQVRPCPPRSTASAVEIRFRPTSALREAKGGKSARRRSLGTQSLHRLIGGRDGVAWTPGSRATPFRGPTLPPPSSPGAATRRGQLRPAPLRAQRSALRPAPPRPARQSDHSGRTPLRVHVPPTARFAYVPCPRLPVLTDREPPGPLHSGKTDAGAET